MILHVIGSSSNGNCYILESVDSALILDAGCPLQDVKVALNFQINKIKGCLITHEHGDHFKYINDYLKAGIRCYGSEGTFGTMVHPLISKINIGEKLVIGGGFTTVGFKVPHDAADPINYMIHHKECGNVVYLTDLRYSPVRFNNLHNILIEANYSKDIIARKHDEGAPSFLTKRIIDSHMSLETTIETLEANDLSCVQKIILIHLSDRNSDEKLFTKTISERFYIKTIAADAGMKIDLNKTPF